MTEFTIITCTYNAASVLCRTLDSVRLQTGVRVEHIIIDGASSDGTMDIVEDYARKAGGHEVKFTSEPDRGLYDAMNKGLQRATGDYLLFLNAGDTLPAPDTLLTVASAVDGTRRPAVIYGDTDIVDLDGRFLRHRRLAPPEHLSWRSFRRGMLVCHQAFYVRRDIAQSELYNLSYRYSADVDWCIRVMRRAAAEHLSLTYVHAVVAHYLDGGMSVANHRASLKERFHVMCTHYGVLSTVVMHLWFAGRSFIKR